MNYMRSLSGRGGAASSVAMPEGLLSWGEIRERAEAAGFDSKRDVTRGPVNTHTHTRLFGDEPAEVVLYRDNHYWCPYCEKVQLFLEAKRIPYTMKLVTMFCYGKKETWYKQLVPSGMLPALSLTPTGPIVTESDDIMHTLEARFGPLTPGGGMGAAPVVAHRRLERRLFRAWCEWLCYPSSSAGGEARSEAAFKAVAEEVEALLAATGGPFMLGPSLSVADCVYVPYLERMNASLFYYKGYRLREQHPRLHAWFAALESCDEYRGMASDFHTHAHDLPPQMGGCYSSGTPRAKAAAALVDQGPFSAAAAAAAGGAGLAGLQVDLDAWPEPLDACAEAAWRLAKHAPTLAGINPYGAGPTDAALRAASTLLLTGSLPAVVPAGCAGPTGPASAGAANGAAVALAARYVRDRLSCPRDMPLHSAGRLRDALEAAARAFEATWQEAGQAAGDARPEPVALKNRFDANPEPFRP